MAQWKKVLILFYLLTVTSLLAAHEFWLQPEKFICKRGETINIRFKVGENFYGENWLGNLSRVKSLSLYLKDTKDDLSELLTRQTGDSLQLAIFDEGTAMVTFNSTNAFLKMNSGSFSDYLKEENLTDALLDRERNNENGKQGKEFFQRSVKTLIQVGRKYNNSFKQTTELPVDIIPQLNPYLLKNNQLLTIKILFQKKPMGNATISVWQRLKNITHRQQLKTNSKGELKFKVNTRGKWMLSTVKMTRLENDSKANWQSYWGSLTWGYN